MQNRRQWAIPKKYLLQLFRADPATRPFITYTSYTFRKKDSPMNLLRMELILEEIKFAIVGIVGAWALCVRACIWHQAKDYGSSSGCFSHQQKHSIFLKITKKHRWCAWCDKMQRYLFHVVCVLCVRHV